MRKRADPRDGRRLLLSPSNEGRLFEIPAEKTLHRTAIPMHDPPDVSAELKSFLRGWLASYEQLETLLLLRQRRDDGFFPASVAEFLHVSETAAAEALEHLCRVSLVEVQLTSDDTRIFKYAPGSIHLGGLVDQLADAWDRNQLTVMNLMSSNAIERVRTGALRTFADAFVLGRKKTDG